MSDPGCRPHQLINCSKCMDAAVVADLREQLAARDTRIAELEKQLDEQIRENSLMVTEDLVQERGAQEMLYDRLAQAVEWLRVARENLCCVMMDPAIFEHPKTAPCRECGWCGIDAYIAQYSRWESPVPDSDMPPTMSANEPVHRWFELSYSQYLTIPRTALQSMPVGWQQRFVRCLEELDRRIKWRPESGRYWVGLRDRQGRYVHDPLMDYERGRRRLPVRP
jgi:hypothetical protein